MEFGDSFALRGEQTLPFNSGVMEFEFPLSYPSSTSRHPLAFDVESQTTSVNKRGFWKRGNLAFPAQPQKWKPVHSERRLRAAA
jgi:hypothetical protein